MNPVVDDHNPKANREDDKADIAKIISQSRESLRNIHTVHVSERHKELDLEYLIRTMHALINSNNEIWGRCKNNLHHNNDRCNQLSDKAVFIFYRVGFHVVEVLPELTDQNNEAENIVLKSLCSMQSKTFPIPCFPDLLSTFVPPTIDKNGMLNYSEYFKRSFSLEESILLLFFANLKDHLEEIQVFLGEVESWLLGSSRGANFIHHTFSVAVQVKELIHKTAMSDICIRCGEKARSHEKRVTKSNRQVLMCQGYDFDGHVHEGRFVMPSTTILETIASTHPYKLTFDVSNSTGQEKLKLFLAFIKHPD